jgi:PAP2 superfamily
VQNVALSWQQAGLLAGGLYATSYAAGRARSSVTQRAWPFLREAGTIAVLYGLWQLVGTLSVTSADGAFARGRSLVRLEAAVHLPREATVQSWILPHPLLCQLCNLYYAGLHFAGLFALLIWLFIRHRDRYAQARSSIVVLTAACLAIQFLAVAPPRLVPQAGVVDVAEIYGQSVYYAGATGADQLSAMPSVHVAWALLIAVIVIRSSPSSWRWLALIYPTLTVLVVVATGNHFWLDGIVAAALLALGEVALSTFRHFVVRSSSLNVSRSETVYSSV